MLQELAELENDDDQIPVEVGLTHSTPLVMPRHPQGIQVVNPDENRDVVPLNHITYLQ